MESTSSLVPSKTLSKSAVNPVFFFESSIILPAVVSATTPVPKVLKQTLIDRNEWK